MVKILIRAATQEDVDFIAGHLRASDVVELRLSQSSSPDEAVRISHQHSKWTKCVLVDDLPSILYGVSPTDIPDHGTPWMLATDDIKKIKHEFLAGCQSEIEEMRNSYPFLFNQVHQDNIVSINWLRKFGFHVDQKPAGPFGEFFNFWMGVPNA